MAATLPLRLPRVSQEPGVSPLSRPAHARRPSGEYRLRCVCNIRGECEEKKIDAERVADLGRRNFFLKSAVATASLFPLASGSCFPLPAFADDASPLELEVYEDVKDSYSFLVPKDWKFGEARLGSRKVVGFYPEGKADINVNLVITMLGADFTTLGSFGTADIFGENLVNSMDRSYLRPPGQEAKLLSAKSSNDKYYIEYTLKKPGEEKKHFFSVVGINFNGIYNRLFTLTGQYPESESAVYQDPLKKIITSFQVGKQV